MLRVVDGNLPHLGTGYINLLGVHFLDFVTPLDEIVRGDVCRDALHDNEFGDSVGVQPRRA